MFVSIRRVHPACRVALAALILFASSVQAKSLFKCPESGRITYRDTPCAGAIPMEAPAQPASTDIASAEIRAFREKADLLRLEGRLTGQAVMPALARRGSQRRAAAYEPDCTTLALKMKWSADDGGSSRAATRANGRTRSIAERRARRLVEQYTAECAQPGHMISVSGAPLTEPISAFPTLPRRAARQ
jgi:hypothetical protein